VPRALAVALVALAALAALAALLGCSSSSSGGGSPDGAAPADAEPGDAAARPDVAHPEEDAGSEGGGPACVSDAGAPSAAEFSGGQFDCQPKSCQLTGSVNGTDVVMSFALGPGFAFVNGSKFDADFGTAGHLHLQLGSMLVPYGSAGTASGTVTLPAEFPVLAGHSLCVGDGTHFEPVQVDGGNGGVNFILRCLSDGCSSAVDGEIDGCCMP
jgi:hypothetical protein